MGEPKKRSGTAKSGVRVTATWRNPIDVAPLFVDQMHIHRMDDLFYVTVGRTEVPFNISQEPQPSEVVADIVPEGRYIMPLDAIKRVRDLLNRMLNDEDVTP